MPFQLFQSWGHKHEKLFELRPDPTTETESKGPLFIYLHRPIVEVVTIKTIKGPMVHRYIYACLCIYIFFFLFNTGQTVFVHILLFTQYSLLLPVATLK